MTEFGYQRQRETEQSGNLNPLRTHRGPGKRNGAISARAARTLHAVRVFCKPGRVLYDESITLMRRFTEDIDRAFGLRGGSNRGDFSELQDISWIPPVEVRQSGNNLVIHADLPGLSENDVKVEATDEGLVIQGGAPARAHVGGRRLAVTRKEYMGASIG